MLEHGGRVRAAARHYGIPYEDWLDLSTGLNPLAYPVPPITAASWQRLPELEDGLEEAARDYYGARSLLTVAGSQAAIQALPRLRKPGAVAIAAGSYAEHEAAWRAAGHRIVRPDGDEELPPWLDVLVLVNPDNPTARQYPREKLLSWQRQLAARGGWLVVDEAFADVRPEHSLAADSHHEGLIVLRSLGKFFGLAGARVGFVLAAPPLLSALQRLLGPWPVSGPARVAARAALADRDWQHATRQRLLADSQRLRTLLEEAGLACAGSTPLFAYVPHEDAARLAEHHARAGILLRCFTQPAALRFGLPGTGADWQRLTRHLRTITP
ncbi:threonine-phosphate decarboxylase CobD [Alkalilimnicola sp. S0819]|uniref:threonine-phosphate decarboxylase CobD n=1 Tax=Alkalilimnicola sp. S0819 TaxID=2613922 RepID=UPI001261E844|nr:threonine-phosphate decarboxylase CobD [Alkalilimnicola sp. S0819]KAB7623376.1 threonine-phosphate decarboxylase [Alkalilimnicola sp. S0819]MPQ16917.1 threonine-phosphate decarboxylase [Alkalilimnicola sp. S0819]